MFLFMASNDVSDVPSLFPPIDFVSAPASQLPTYTRGSLGVAVVHGEAAPENGEGGAKSLSLWP